MADNANVTINEKIIFSFAGIEWNVVLAGILRLVIVRKKMLTRFKRKHF
jgi:hypothetical protein